MNNTVTLSQLITRLAKVADTDTNTSRRFLRTFFGAIEEALIEGESVTIKGIGTFRRSSDTAFGSPSGISFVPDEQLAKELNAPFEMFQAVELADGVVFPEEKEDETTAKEESAPEPRQAAPVQQPEPVRSQPEVSAPASQPLRQEPLKPEQVVPKPEPVQAKTEAAVGITPDEPHKAPWEMDEFKPKETPHPLVKPREETGKPVPPVFEIADNIDNDVPPVKKKPVSNLIWIGVALIIICGGFLGLFAASYFDDEEIAAYNTETTDSIAAPLIEEISVSDVPETGANATAEPAGQTSEPQAAAPAATSTAASAAAQPAVAEAPAKKEPRYDTVTKTNYLAQMARRYYGHATYWVFIYEANTDVLRNPNRISPGTRVRIPEESELPGSTSAERQKIASQKCGELERKYK